MSSLNLRERRNQVVPRSINRAVSISIADCTASSTLLSRASISAQIVNRPLPQDDPKQRRPDISQANALLGWEPRIGLTEGLKKTIAYFEEMISAGLVQRVTEPV